ncbi:MAG: pinensin family lanthipeptide [Bacteroidota bacterium]
MAKKKFTLSSLKVNSFVTSLDQRELQTAKGGIDYKDRLNILNGLGGNWTDHKSQLVEVVSSSVTLGGLSNIAVRQVTSSDLKKGR